MNYDERSAMLDRAALILQTKMGTRIIDPIFVEPCRPEPTVEDLVAALEKLQIAVSGLCDTIETKFVPETGEPKWID